MAGQENDKDGSGPMVDQLREQPAQSMVNVHVVDRITFSNLEAMVPPAPKRAADSPELTEMLPEALIQPEQQASGVPIGYIILIVVLVVFGGYLAFEFMGKTPATVEVGRAASTQAATPALQSPPAEKLVAPSGELQVGSLQIRPAQGKRKKGVFRVEGIIKNETNRIQKAIDFEVTVLRNKIPVHQSRQRCCQAGGGQGDGIEILRPGQSSPFGFEVSGLGRKPNGLDVQGRIVFADSEKVMP